MSYKALIIDDEKEMLESLKKILSRRQDISVTVESDGQKAIDIINNNSLDFIISDLKMGKVSGMDILKIAGELAIPTPVIMISGYGTVAASVDAMRNGAFDFLEKPFSSKSLFACIDKLLGQKKSLALKTDTEKEDLSFAAEMGIIYQSEQMRQVLSMVAKISRGNMDILVTGESGTGKEIIARAIHSLSPRSKCSFVPVNCGALPEHLFESELFGHEKGAFTGAVKTKPGLLEFADKGTFFFDEIGELSLALQVKLLRMLEERKIRRVGGQQEVNIDVRIISATNKDLEILIDDGKFREDLYYRLNPIQIIIPPLRERKDDIILLAENYLDGLADQNNRRYGGLTKDVRTILEEYPWPGNIRELQNVLTRAFFLMEKDIITPEDLPIRDKDSCLSIDSDIAKLSYKEAKAHVMEKFEVEYLTRCLKRNNGNISKTALECGLDRRSIHRLVNKYNIIYQD